MRALFKVKDRICKRNNFLTMYVKVTIKYFLIIIHDSLGGEKFTMKSEDISLTEVVLEPFWVFIVTARQLSSYRGCPNIVPSFASGYNTDLRIPVFLTQIMPCGN